MPHPHLDPLLAEFVATRSESAFRALVERHIDLIHATATRQLRGDAHTAQDIAQEVFALLARKAERLPKPITVAGWLYRQTCRRCANHVRTETRRRKREALSRMDKTTPASGMNTDWSNLAPELDNALLTLPDTDRDIIVLRYFEERPHREIGTALGVSEDAARKRTARALEKLRAKLSTRGVRIGATPLAAALAANAITPAPAGAAGAIALPSAALAGSLLANIATQAAPALGGALFGLATIAIVHAATPSQPTEPAATVSRTPVTALPRDPSPHWARPLRENMSLQQILDEFVALAGEPQHSLTSLKRDALLDTIPVSSFAELVELAHTQLEIAELSRIHLPLYQRWADFAPDQALASALAHSPVPQNNNRAPGQLIRDIHNKFVIADRHAAAKWFSENASVMRDTPLGGKPLQSMAARLYTSDGAKPALEFIASLPTGELRNETLSGLIGDETAPATIMRQPADWTAVLDVIPSLDSASSHDLAVQLWRRWGEEAPDDAAAHLATLSAPAARFCATLGLARVGKEPKQRTQTREGHRLSYSQVTDHAERIAELMEASRAAGVDPADALAQVGRAGGTTARVPLLTLLECRVGSELDDIIVERALPLMMSPSRRKGLHYKTAFLKWVTAIHDTSRRDRFLTGTVRRLLVENRKTQKSFSAREISRMNYAPASSRSSTSTPQTR